MTRTLPSRLLPGVPLIGFYTAFDESKGASGTPWPYPIVTPSAVGPALLPFHCPHCGAVCDELVDPKTRMFYFDKNRKFSWCPKADCRGRFFVDRTGMPLAEPLPAGASAAPSMVERFVEGEKKPTKSMMASSGRFDMLGALPVRATS